MSGLWLSPLYSARCRETRHRSNRVGFRFFGRRACPDMPHLLGIETSRHAPRVMAGNYHQLLDADLYLVCRPPGRREYDVYKLAPDERVWDQNVELIQPGETRRGRDDDERRRRSAYRGAYVRLRRGSDSGAECDQEYLIGVSPEIDLDRVETVGRRI